MSFTTGAGAGVGVEHALLMKLRDSPTGRRGGGGILQPDQPETFKFEDNYLILSNT